jgi:parallel beta-helix repeat protein
VKSIERRTGQALGILSGLPVTLLIGVVPVQAQSTPVTACGQVLSAPGHYHLTGNLGPCAGHGVVITASSVHFTLAGFTISGIAHTNACDFEKAKVGILVERSGQGLLFVRVNGGTVTGFFDGIALGASSSRVNAMTVADSCLFGIGAFGTRNVIETNVVTRNGYAGVFLGSSDNSTIRSNDISGNTSCGLFINDSNGNTIRSNIVKDNGRQGICADSGNDNVIQGNDASGNLEGIYVSGTGTIIRDNTANGNVNVGIVILAGSSSHTVIGNNARSNGIADLSDGNVGCDANSWKRNGFGTDSVAGASDGGPGTGCIK